ncbi:MAG: pilus assembly FimT family protein [Desulfohalobiaceae bacterium]
MQHPHTRNRGVTLVEMMVVLAIAAIIIGIGVAYLDTHDARARSAAYTMKTRLMGAKSTAVKLNENVQVNFDTDNEVYNATSGGSLLFEVHLDQGVDLSSASSVTFTPLGMANATSIVLKGLTGGNYTISVNTIGRIQLQRIP